MIEHIFSEETFEGFKAQIEVASCICICKGRFLLLRKTKVWPGYWTPPGGRMEADETTLHGAIREMQEETGHLITNTLCEAPKTFYIRNKWGDYILNTFLVKFEDEFSPTLSFEHDQYTWVLLDKALQMKLITGGHTLLPIYQRIFDESN